MKIGILTFWWSNNNYGQILQCYALQKFLRDKGHDTFLIRYDFSDDIIQNTFLKKCLNTLNPKKLFHFFKEHLINFLLKKEEKKHNRQFDEFRKKYIQQSNLYYSTYYELKQNPPKAGMYIVGSDQVWNYSSYPLWRYKNPTHAYYLDFGDINTKRISYAASWGKESISDEYKIEIQPLLKKFNYVSVREETGILLCKQCGISNVEWVCDPTLLLSAEEYRELYKENTIQKQNKPFILLYILGNKCKFNIQHIYDFAAKKNLEVIYVTGNELIDKRKKIYATIPEWIWLVDNAEYVISNSFHCAVFSTIFHKKFGIIPLTGEASSMNERFNSFFNSRGTGSRYITENDFSILEKEYKVKEIQISQKFLKILSN